MSDQPDGPSRLSRRIEIATAILLAVAAVATAWASYQASRWRGEQSLAQAKASATRIESTRSSDLANGQTEVDVATFIQWSDAMLHDDAPAEEFYRTRFRDEFTVAFDAWLALDPLQDPSAPPTPFAMSEYVLDARIEADRLQTDAEGLSAVAQDDVQKADNYMLCVVLFASALFFAGISTRLRSDGHAVGHPRPGLRRVHRRPGLDAHVPDELRHLRHVATLSSGAPGRTRTCDRRNRSPLL